jgi:hypothetical protein
MYYLSTGLCGASDEAAHQLATLSALNANAFRPVCLHTPGWPDCGCNVGGTYAGRTAAAVYNSTRARAALIACVACECRRLLMWGGTHEDIHNLS